MKYKAQCACKNASITLSGEPELCFACHCDYCQRLTGSVALTAAVFNQDCVVSVQGDFSEFDPKLDDWPNCKRHFCPNCASTVHWTNPTTFPGMRLVSFGCFSDLNVNELDFVVQTQYRHKWCAAFAAQRSSDVFLEV